MGRSRGAVIFVEDEVAPPPAEMGSPLLPDPESQPSYNDPLTQLKLTSTSNVQLWSVKNVQQHHNNQRQ